jgi:signal transduction histidine kinase
VAARTTELSAKNAELGATLTRLRETQRQLVMQEKLASLGALTAGIAHEIRNPLNFISNFSSLTGELAEELDAVIRPALSRLEPETWREAEALLGDVRQNTLRIREHGRRANDIVTGMLQHAREDRGEITETDLNALLAESVGLAYQGVRRKVPEFSMGIDASYDPAIGPIEANTNQLRRVFINVVNNACDALREKQRLPGADGAPLLTVRTQDLGERVEVRIRDNGTGIPAPVLPRIFHPFFTTKPPGEGTGLGLSLSHDIIVAGHRGEIQVRTEEKEFTEFIITLPKRGVAERASRSA